MRTSSSVKRKAYGRGLIAHLGAYTILIGTLAGINLLTSTEVLWFLFPALVWGAGLMLHLFWKIPLARLRPKWRRFLRHLGTFLIIIGALVGINIVASTEVLWFLFPALIWGAGLAWHFLFGIVLSKQQNPTQPPIRPVNLTDKANQARLNKALTYRAQINTVIETTSNENARARLQALAAQVDEWIEAINDLALRVDYFQHHPLIRRDLETLPTAVLQLKARLARETNRANRIELERTLHNYQKQLAALEQLGEIMKRAEIQIESTLSALGAVYFQILTGQSASHVADYSHLAAEVDEEVQLLQDRLEALQEVKFGRI